MFGFGLLLALSSVCLGVGINEIIMGRTVSSLPWLVLALIFVVLAIAIALIGLKKKG